MPNMPPADFLADVLAYIGAHCFEPLTVADLATVAKLSPYHFSRLFTARFGESVMGYVRTCRLQAAALRLAGSAPPPLIELALDCGFESQEAFTRAFRRRYGVPPGRFLRGKILHQPKEPQMPETSTTIEQLPDLVARPAFNVAGVRAQFDGEAASGIPSLWLRLIKMLPLPGQADGITYGVVWMENKAEGRFNYMAAVEISGTAPLPPGFETLQLAAQTYLVFRLTLDGGPMHPQMRAVMPKIWGELLPASGYRPVQAPDLEVHPADFQPMRKGGYLDLYIAVE